VIEELEGTAFHRYLVSNYDIPKTGLNFNYVNGLKKIWDYQQLKIDDFEETIDRCLGRLENCTDANSDLLFVYRLLLEYKVKKQQING